MMKARRRPNAGGGRFNKGFSGNSKNRFSRGTLQRGRGGHRGRGRGGKNDGGGAGGGGKSRPMPDYLLSETASSLVDIGDAGGAVGEPIAQLSMTPENQELVLDVLRELGWGQNYDGDMEDEGDEGSIEDGVNQTALHYLTQHLNFSKEHGIQVRNACFAESAKAHLINYTCLCECAYVFPGIEVNSRQQHC